MNHDTLHRLKERGIDEMRRFLIMFVYLWVVFGLFVLNESLILGQHSISFAPQGFAIVNAAIMAKVMLIGEDLRLGRQFDHLPLIYPTAHKAGLFALVFMLFHALERILVGTLGGHSLSESMPHMGGGTWPGRFMVWAIMTVSLLPFFALREIGQFMGEGRLWRLMFVARPRSPASRD